MSKRKRRTARSNETHRDETYRDQTHRIDPEIAAQNMDRQGPSPGDPIDEMVIRARKSGWIEKSAAAAGDEVTPDELKAFDLLGRSSVRDDAIEGVSSSDEIPMPPEGRTPGALRKNPPLAESAGETIGEGEADDGR